MRRLGLALGVIVALLAAAGRADAHPLGNFSVNHLAVVSIARDAVDVRWILDQAEVPTFQERGLAPREVLARKRAAAEAGLALRVDGRAVALRPLRSRRGCQRSRRGRSLSLQRNGGCEGRGCRVGKTNVI